MGMSGSLSVDLIKDIVLRKWFILCVVSYISTMKFSLRCTFDCIKSFGIRGCRDACHHASQYEEGWSVKAKD